MILDLQISSAHEDNRLLDQSKASNVTNFVN